MDLHGGIPAESEPCMNPAEDDRDNRAACPAINEHTHRWFEPCIFATDDQQLSQCCHQEEGNWKVRGGSVGFEALELAGICRPTSMIAIATKAIAAATT